MEASPDGSDPDPPRLPTMADVAREAGVSSTTVSFVINNRLDQSISELTRRRVLDAVELLGYRPNRAARNLQSQRTATIGYLSNESADNPFSGQSIAGAHDSAWKHGSALLVVNTTRDTQRLLAGIHDLLDRRVDAILFAAVGTRRVTLPDPLSQVPTVLVNCYLTDASLPSVMPDDEDGGYRATRMLLDAGHREIAYLAGRPGAWATRARVRGYRRALTEQGLDPKQQIVRFGNYMADSGYDLTRQVLAGPSLPTALLCGNDRMALGAYLALGEAGLQVPRDMSVVGYDDQPTLAGEIHPRLSTVRLPYYRMGWWAAEQLLSRQVGSLPAQTLIPAEVVPRDSVAAPRPGDGTPARTPGRTPPRPPPRERRRSPG
jgi:LacI family transcriptional regulator